MRREQDAIANLRAEWSKLDRPDRLQELAAAPPDAEADRYRVSYDQLDKLPERAAADRAAPIVPIPSAM